MLREVVLTLLFSVVYSTITYRDAYGDIVRYEGKNDELRLYHNYEDPLIKDAPRRRVYYDSLRRYPLRDSRYGAERVMVGKPLTVEKDELLDDIDLIPEKNDEKKEMKKESLKDIPKEEVEQKGDAKKTAEKKDEPLALKDTPKETAEKKDEPLALKDTPKETAEKKDEPLDVKDTPKETAEKKDEPLDVKDAPKEEKKEIKIIDAAPKEVKKDEPKKEKPKEEFRYENLFQDVDSNADVEVEKSKDVNKDEEKTAKQDNVAEPVKEDHASVKMGNDDKIKIHEQADAVLVREVPISSKDARKESFERFSDHHPARKMEDEPRLQDMNANFLGDNYHNSRFDAYPRRENFPQRGDYLQRGDFPQRGDSPRLSSKRDYPFMLANQHGDAPMRRAKLFPSAQQRDAPFRRVNVYPNVRREDIRRRIDDNDYSFDRYAF